MTHRKNGFNLTKYPVLDCISRTTKPLSPEEIAGLCRLPVHSVKNCLTHIWQMDYIYRAKERRRHRRNYYTYRCLKPKGKRTLAQFQQRKEIERVTGQEVSLNLRKPIPYETMKLYETLKSPSLSSGSFGSLSSRSFT